MPKRTLWATVGYSAGIATSVYVQRRVRRVVQRVAPAEVRDAMGTKGSEAVERARRLGSTLRLAAGEGRTVMRDTERRLRNEHQLPPR